MQPSSEPSWSDVENLFFDALEIPESERGDWLRRRTANHPALEREVLSLIQAHQHAATNEAPQRIGSYRRERLLGRGGMGEVWLASRADGQYEQRAALKLVRPGAILDPLLSRFRQERQLLARLNHPHIARLLDGGVASDGRPYLVMEYIEGAPIVRFAEERSLDVEARLELVRKLCSAVAYAHRNFIVHRDIKPANVLVTAEGSPKLLDFGVAKLLESDDAAATGALLATPNYASPEQLRGGPVTTASDVYSLGVLLFELLTGKLPERSESAPRLSAAVADGRRAFSRDLDAIVAKALENNPEDRYPDADSLSNDLTAYLESRPVAARTATSFYVLRKYVRRHRVGATLAGLMIMAVAAASAISIREAWLARKQRDRAERVTRFLEQTLTSASPLGGNGLRGGAKLDVLDLLLSASKRIDPAFPGDRASQARLHRLLADALIGLREFRPAQGEVNAALERIGSLDDNPAEKARVLYAAGYLDLLLHRYPAAGQLLRQTIDAYPQADASNPGFFAIAEGSYAAALAALNNPRDAERFATRGVAAMESLAHPPPMKMGALKVELAWVALRNGDLKLASDEAREAAASLAIANAQSEMSGANTLLGEASWFSGDRDQAFKAFQASYEDAVRAVGADSPLTLPSRINYAIMRALAGDPGAVDDLRACADLARKKSNSEDEFHAFNALAYALTREGREREAEPLFVESLRLGRQVLGAASPYFAIAEVEYGECLERQGRSKEAAQMYHSAYDAFRARFGPDVWVSRDAESRWQRVNR